MILFKCTIPGRVGIKKNGKNVFKRGNRTFVLSSNAFKAWERHATVYILQSKIRAQTVLPIQTPVILTCRFYAPNHHGEADLSNLYQGIEDLLEKLEIIDNDKLIYSHDGSCKIFGAQDFRVEIEIKPFTPL